MKEYFKNLLTALCGRNPYQQELDKLREEMNKAGENVRMLQESYYKEVDKAAQAEKLLESYKTLVENYRERLDEKDAMINDIRKDYQRQVENYEKRVGDYSRTIAELQKKNEELHIIIGNAGEPHESSKDSDANHEVAVPEHKVEV